MTFPSTIASCSHPSINLVFPNGDRTGLLIKNVRKDSSLQFPSRNVVPKINSRNLRLRIKAAVSSDGSYSGRGAISHRAYRQSQAQAPAVPIKETANTILPVCAFFVVTFILRTLVEQFLLPKPAKYKSGGRRKLSFDRGTNLLPHSREEILRLDDRNKDLMSSRSVDMSGCSIGDEGLFSLAKETTYNPLIAEEINFAANGITADGIKALDGILQSNTALRSLNLSGNPIGEEGVKYLCAILANNESVQKLKLSRSCIGDEGAEAIVQMLSKNSTLTVIDLSDD